MSEKDYYYSKTEEYFNEDSLEELGLEDGDTYYRCERKEITGSELVRDDVVETIVEGMCEVLYDEVGEVAEGNIHVSLEAADELKKTIQEWADKHVGIGCWKAINTEQLTYAASQASGELNGDDARP